jgi:hypothetical protein
MASKVLPAKTSAGEDKNSIKNNVNEHRCAPLGVFAASKDVEKREVKESFMVRSLLDLGRNVS